MSRLLWVASLLPSCLCFGGFSAGQSGASGTCDAYLAEDGSFLPFPMTPSASTVGETLATSEHKWRQDPPRLSEDAPNIVMFLTDDSGYSNTDTFGGPIHTPTFSRIAEAGITFNRFHTTAMCSPTRSALLTGRNHHFVGNGQIAEFSSDWDGYIGEIPRTTATIAKVLRGYGYNTAAFGKWHNTSPLYVTPIGPFDQWPTGLGFDYFYGFMAGEDSQYEPKLFERTNPVEPEKTPEEGYHLTEDLADKAIKFIRNSILYTPEKPFFIYFAPGAVHGPHHVTSEWVDKYKGKFDAGWEVLRNETFAKQKEMGWIPEDAVNTPIDPRMQKWEDIPEEQRAFQIRLMEIFAGFLEHTDVQYGRIVDELEAQGVFDNTIVIYIGSDNGPSAEGIDGTISELLAQNSVPSTFEDQMKRLEELGGLDALGTKVTENMYHHGWAWAGASPYQSTKLVASHLGGTRTPVAISWPKGIKADTTIRSGFHHVIDIVPTIYEILGIPAPESVEGTVQDPIHGMSMAYAFDDGEAEGPSRTQYFEIMGSRGVYQDGWFAGTFGPRVPWSTNVSGVLNWDPNTDEWELYNLDEDFSQGTNLAADMPEKVEEMKKLFLEEAAANKVLPVGAGLYTVVYSPSEIRASSKTEWNLTTADTRIGESNAPKYQTGFDSRCTITATMPTDETPNGVLYAIGGSGGGVTVYVLDGYLKAEYNTLIVYIYRAESSSPLPTGEELTIDVDMKWDGKEIAAPGTLTLSVNGEQVAETRVEKSVSAIFTAAETFDVGIDLGAPVSDEYEHSAPFKFNGDIKSVYCKFL